MKARLSATGSGVFSPIGLAFTRTVKRLKRAPAPPASPAPARGLFVGRNAKIAWVGSAVAIVVVVIVAAAVVRTPVAIPPTGIVVIDAVPWGTITAIDAENGEGQPLPAQASTPVSITLPAGTYQVLVAGPRPDVAPQRFSVRVEPNATTVAPPVSFGGLTPEEYFEQYLAAPSDPAETVSPSDATVPAETPTVTPTPAGVGQ